MNDQAAAPAPDRVDAPAAAPASDRVAFVRHGESTGNIMSVAKPPNPARFAEEALRYARMGIDDITHDSPLSRVGEEQALDFFSENDNSSYTFQP